MDDGNHCNRSSRARGGGVDMEQNGQTDEIFNI